MDLVYECFVKLGLRYICVLRDGKYAGMVSSFLPFHPYSGFPPSTSLRFHRETTTRGREEKLAGNDNDEVC